MISKNDIIKMAHHIKRRGSDIKDRALIHPKREWLFGLLVFLLVTAGGAAYNAYIFNQYASMEDVVTANELSRTNYNQQAVTRVLKLYDSKAKSFESLYVGFPDSSISIGTTTVDITNFSNENSTITDSLEEEIETESAISTDPVTQEGSETLAE